MEFNTTNYIWKSFVAGDTKAFAELYKIYAVDLFNYGFKITNKETLIQDCIQDLFIELWNNRHKLQNVEHPKTYLLKALHYKLLRLLKKENKIAPIEIEEVHVIEKELSIDTTWILEEIKQERTEILHQELHNLPLRQREVLHLKYFQNLSSQQIGEMLNINTQSVSNLLYRGITNLRKLILKKH